MTLREFIMEQTEGMKPEDAEIEVDKKETSDGKFEFLVKVKVDGADEKEAKEKLSDALSEFDAKIKAKKAEKKEDDSDEKEEDESEGDYGRKFKKSKSLIKKIPAIEEPCDDGACAPAKKFKKETCCPNCGKVFSKCTCR